MKKCSDCKKLKLEKEFPFDKSRNRILSVCKSCTSLRTQDYRKVNPQRWKEYDKNRQIKLTEIINSWKEIGCQKCGDKRLYTLDAHHVDPSKKEYFIGDKDMGPNKLKKELVKCIPLCSNCHREFHYLEKLNNTTIQEYLKQ